MKDTTDERVREASSWYAGKLLPQQLHFCPECGGSLTKLKEGMQCRACQWEVWNK